MQGKIVKRDRNYIIEYTVQGEIHRRIFPRAIFPNAIFKAGDIVSINENKLHYGIEYSDVDLVDSLGKELPAINVRVLEQELRKVGVWTRRDYLQNSELVAGVVAKMRNLDVFAIIKAATSDV